MPQPKQGPRLASSPAHERLMLANMATSLYRNGSLTTTVAKAKRLRPLAERLITFAKRGDLSSRRRVMRVIRDKSVVNTLFTDIAKQMEDRHGGYTRIIKLAPRRGDDAPLAVISLVTEAVHPHKPADEAQKVANNAVSSKAPAAPSSKSAEKPAAKPKRKASDKGTAASTSKPKSDSTSSAASKKPASKTPSKPEAKDSPSSTAK